MFKNKSYLNPFLKSKALKSMPNHLEHKKTLNFASIKPTALLSLFGYHD